MSLTRHHHLVKYLRRWHRRVGVTAAVFAIVLAVTGVLLNHTEGLALDSRYVRSELVLDWYGIAPPGKPVSYPVGGHWVSQLGGYIYFDEQTLAIDEPGHLLGAVGLAGNVIIAVEGQIVLLSAAGEVLEILGGAQGVPAGMRQIGVKDDKLVVRASHGDYFADKDLLHWDESEEVGDRHVPVVADWAKVSAPPEGLYAKLVEAYRGKGLTLERVLLDLHSGRIAGLVGVAVVDVSAILFILLAISGIWMWVRHVRPAHH
ncbi:MAG: PepSY domain-containing protein [Gammaproteobacteria bacterium]|nr:PepSY domain-containing protein [Gammaproteobacteria bacterium]